MLAEALSSFSNSTFARDRSCSGQLTNSGTASDSQYLAQGGVEQPEALPRIGTKVKENHTRVCRKEGARASSEEGGCDGIFVMNARLDPGRPARHRVQLTYECIVKAPAP